MLKIVSSGVYLSEEKFSISSILEQEKTIKVLKNEISSLRKKFDTCKKKKKRKLKNGEIKHYKTSCRDLLAKAEKVSSKPGVKNPLIQDILDIMNELRGII